MKIKPILFLVAVCAVLLPHSHAQQKPLRVLTISGDWKSQSWYQDVWMQGRGTDRKGEHVRYRGRFIAQEVERAAPGRFEFKDITNATAQQYGDQLFAQHDVVVMGDVVGWSFPPRFHTALRKFVQDGGGLIYAASNKWNTALMKNTPFEETLPAAFPISGFTHDWKDFELSIKERNFSPQVAPGQTFQPIVAGLDFASVPTLDRAFIVLPKPGAQILLQSPGGAPLLVAHEFGRGRSVVSSSIWANDELSPKIGAWKDFGRFYAQLLSWTGARSTRPQAAPRAAAPTTVALRVDATGGAANTVGPKSFGIHASHDDPGLAPLGGETLKNFEALNLRGAFSRFSPHRLEEKNDNDDPNLFNWAAFNFDNTDRELAQMNRLGLEPLLLVSDFGYGRPQWLWKETNSKWSDPSPQAIAEAAEYTAAVVEHINGGKGGDPNYKLNVRYLEIANEPNLKSSTIPGFARLFKGIAARIHRDYPGVQVGTFGGYEIPYLPQFLEAVNPDMDWVSRHPYGWTGEMVMAQQDATAAWMKAKGLREIPFIITEWDFWIQGREKFDYMMRRNFEAVKRPNLIGTLHYRLGQYPEPIYLFGVLWTGWGRERGAGEKGTPMHDAYDAFYLWRDFRGARVPVQQFDQIPGAVIRYEPNHVLADAARDGDKVSVVIYNDWAASSPARVELEVVVPPSNRARTLTVTTANGEGFQPVGEIVAVPAGAKTVKRTFDVAPNTGLSVSIQ